MKKCCTCKIEKPYTDFYKDKSQIDGIRNRCKSCVKQYMIKYRIKNSDKLKQISKQYRIDNPDYNKQYQIANADKIKRNRQTPHGRLMMKVKSHKRRVLLNNNTPSGKHWTSNDIIMKFKLQKGKCVYCKISIKSGYDIDHITPISRGGSNEAWNIQLLCKECNGTGGKWNNLSDEFAKKFGMLF